MIRNIPFDGVVDSFSDAVSLFGPEVFHRDGYLVIADPIDGCKRIQPPPAIDTTSPDSNKNSSVSFVSYFVLIQRGGCYFDLKVLNAQQEGYTGVIVFNTMNDKIFPMDGGERASQILIPSVMVDKRAGLKLMNYSIVNGSKEFVISMVSFYSLPLKYVLLSLLILVGISLLILVISFTIHLCRFWRRIHRGRLSRRHLRRLVLKRFTKGLDPYDVCCICLEDYVDRDKLRLLPCQHAFHMKCIDPWLLCNRRHCPICNQIVELPGAPSMVEENETVNINNNDFLRYIPRRFLNFMRHNNQGSVDVPRRRSVDSHQSSEHYQIDEEHTPLLQTDAIQHHVSSDDIVRNSILTPRRPEIHSALQFDEDDDDEMLRSDLVDFKQLCGRSSSSPPAIESSNAYNNMNNADDDAFMNISPSTSPSHNLIQHKLSTNSSKSSTIEMKINTSELPQEIITMTPEMVTTSTMKPTSGDDILITDVNVKIT
ncbi:E3 ubiquitin-protein ligase [Schistosoma japonicum]|nr:E3 ubiquitin-protein ligase [Schistosoma japonicum]